MSQINRMINWVFKVLIVLIILTACAVGYRDLEAKHQIKKREARIEREKDEAAWKERFRAKTYTLVPGEPLIVEVPKGWKILAQSDMPFKFRALRRQSRMPYIVPGKTDDQGWYYTSIGRHFTPWELPNSHQVEAYEYMLWQQPNRPYLSHIEITIGFNE